MAIKFMDSLVSPRDFRRSHSGRMYYAYSGLRGGGAEAALNVDLFNITLSPGVDLFCKIYSGMDWKELDAQIGGMIITINDAVVSDYTSTPSAGGIAVAAQPILYQEFFLPRNSKLLVEGVSDDTDNERYAVMLGYPI